MRNNKLLIAVCLTSLLLCTCNGESEGEIVFASTRDGNSEIYVMDADGSNQRRLTDNSAYDLFPAWSPDGKRIAFVSDRDGNDEIYVMSADGTGAVNLTKNPAMDLHPAWSPDGKKIAFARYSATEAARIHIMNDDGSEQETLTSEQGQFNDTNPHWSPDGSRIVFQSNSDIYGDIYVMNIDGSGRTVLTTHPKDDSDPSWSPDGDRIVFHSEVDQNLLGEICVINPDGSGLKRLTNNSYIDVQPAWSSDGTKIVFVSRRDGPAQIYVMHADGSDPIRLTNSPHDVMPHWKP